MQKLFCGSIHFPEFEEKTAYYCIASTKEDAQKEIEKYQKLIKYVSEVVDITEVPSVINGFEISLSEYEEPKNHMEQMLLMANDTPERLFSIIVTLNNEDHVYHTVAYDSQEAFKQARKDYNDDNLYDMKASIVRFLNGYKVMLKKVS